MGHFPPCFPPFCGNDHDGDSGAAVGGVLLDRSAQVLGNLKDITGAVFDPNTGQLILVGRKDVALPPMNLDDLVVAIRSVYAGQDPGMTMVPVDFTWQDPTQRVEYFGKTEDTHFGLVMFQADRYLKDLAAGQGLTVTVPGFKSEAQLAVELGTEVPWHRNWFLPNEVVVKQADDGKSMVFDRASMQVKSRFIRRLPDGEVVDVDGSSPVTDRFTQFLTGHYDEFARLRPELAELVRLAKIVGVVKWMRDSHIPVDLSWIASYQVAKVDTPKAVPGVTGKACSADGRFCIVSHGGVGYDAENTSRKDDGAVASLREQVLASRPAALPLTWDFARDGQTYTAVSLNLAPAPVVGGFATSMRDLQVPVNGGLLVDFTRYYNSLNLQTGPLGPGWSFTPDALRAQETYMPTGEIVDGKKIYNIEESAVLLTGNGSARFTGPFVRGDRHLYLPERSSNFYQDIVIENNGTYTLRRRDGGVLRFANEGRLLAVEDNHSNRYSYRYDDQGRLVAIADTTGRGIALAYDATGRLTQAVSSDGRFISYGYDAGGRLASVSDAAGPLTSYVYDADDRLVEVRDGQGRTVLKNRYDGLGRLLSQTDGTNQTVAMAYPTTTGPVSYTDPNGNTWSAQYEDGRLVQITDPFGNVIGYAYDAAGRLMALTDERGNTTTLSHDQAGNLIQVQSPSGATTRVVYDAADRPAWIVNPDSAMTMFEYDDRGNPVTMVGGLRVTELAVDGSVRYDSSRAFTITLSYDERGHPIALTDTQGNSAQMEYDAQGNPTVIREPGGSATRLEYDARSRLAAVTDPLGIKLSLSYDDRDHLVSLATTTGSTRYEYDQVGNFVRVVDPLGHATAYDYDAMGRLTAVTEPSGSVTRYEYDAAGKLTKILYPNGAEQRYEYDARGRLIAEVYP